MRLIRGTFQPQDSSSARWHCCVAFYNSSVIQRTSTSTWGANTSQAFYDSSIAAEGRRYRPFFVRSPACVVPVVDLCPGFTEQRMDARCRAKCKHHRYKRQRQTFGELHEQQSFGLLNVCPWSTTPGMLSLSNKPTTVCAASCGAASQAKWSQTSGRESIQRSGGGRRVRFTSRSRHSQARLSAFYTISTMPHLSGNAAVRLLLKLAIDSGPAADQNASLPTKSPQAAQSRATARLRAARAPLRIRIRPAITADRHTFNSSKHTRNA